MKKIKWGILGCANIARKSVIPAIIKADNSEFYAAASRNLKKAEDFVKEFNGQKYYDDYDKLLADENIDAVYIPLPNSMHKEWTVKAAEAGKDVLCEKPISGKNKKEAEIMFQAAEKNNIKLMEGFMYRFQPFVAELKEIIDSGRIGQIKEIKASFAFDISSRTNDIRGNSELDGGALNDIGCYTVNISRYLMDSEPEKVANFFQKKDAAGVDLTGSALLYFEGGRFASLYYSINSYEAKDLEIIGTEGVIKFPGFFAWKKDNYFMLEKDGKTEKIELETEDQYQLEIEAFADSILNDSEVPLKVNEESFANLKVMDAMRRSAAEGIIVEL